MKTLTVLAAVLLSVFALAACGSGSSDDGGGDGTANAASSDDRDTARLKLQECLRKQGIDRGPGQGGGEQGQPPSAAERQKLQKALEGPCKDLAQGAFGNMDDEQRQEFQDAFAKFASCMRKQGIDIPNITPGQGPPAGVQRLNRNSAKFQAAQKACQSLLPEGGRFGPRGGGGAPS